VTLAVWIVGSALIKLTDDLDNFDKRVARVIVYHAGLICQRRLAPQAQAAFDDDAERVVPTGVFDRSKAYKRTGPKKRITR
jgi:hypothetical protein